MLLSGCTVIGALVGNEVDEHLNEDKYGVDYAGIGLEADIDVIKYLIAPKSTEAAPEPDRGICENPDEINTCSAIKGTCWCEVRTMIEGSPSP